MAVFTRSYQVLSRYTSILRCTNINCISAKHINTWPYEFKETEANYPQVKPRWPPGQWCAKDMSEAQAWAFETRRIELQNIDNAKLRLENLAGSFDIPHIDSFPYAFVPRRWKYLRYITKTSFNEGILPDTYKSMDVDHIVQEVKGYVEDCLSALVETNPEIKAGEIEGSLTTTDDEYRHQVIGSILHALISQLSGSNEHLLKSQIDENCRVETFWRRGGYADDRDANEEDKMYVGKGSLTAGTVQIQYHHKADWQIRTELPLPLFVAEDDSICHGPSIDYLYSPMKMGDLVRQDRPINVAGAWINDPCEFTTLSVHCMGNRFERFKQIFGDKETADHVMSALFYTAFGSCVAQALNQGFNELMEITYPFTTQSLVFDGQNIRLCAYQLNTLRLMVSDESNPKQNVAWISDDIKLLDGFENGKVVGLNDEALALLIKCLLIEPTERDGIDLRPYLPNHEAPRLKKQYFNNVGEEIWEEKKIGRFDYPRNSVYYFSFGP